MGHQKNGYTYRDNTMKLSTAFHMALVHAYGGEGSDNKVKSLGMSEIRYIYDTPICQSVQQCRGQNGCDGRVYRARKGIIAVVDYENGFNCLWEIKGAPGTKIRIEIEQTGETFGIENHRACGFDRLNIQNGARDENGEFGKYGRFCSNKHDSGKVHNALTAFNSFNGVKIQNAEWQAGAVELDTNHLQIGFDTDNQGTGKGFTINYEIVGLEEEATFEEVSADLSNQLEDIFQHLAFDQLELNTDLTEKAHDRIKANMQRIHDNMFTKFNDLMDRCKNQDQSSSMHVNVTNTDLNDPVNAKEAWENLMRSSFDVCDLPVTRKGYDQSSWPRRIDRYFNKLAKLLN